MHNIAIVYISPNKRNIRYVVRKFETIEKTFGPVADQIAKQQESLGHVVIFCQTVSDCCMLYRFFRYKLGVKFTIPNGSDDKCNNRIVDMFHSDTEPCIKEEITVKNHITCVSLLLQLLLAWVLMFLTFALLYILVPVMMKTRMFKLLEGLASFWYEREEGNILAS